MSTEMNIYTLVYDSWWHAPSVLYLVRRRPSWVVVTIKLARPGTPDRWQPYSAYLRLDREGCPHYPRLTEDSPFSDDPVDYVRRVGRKSCPAVLVALRREDAERIPSEYEGGSPEKLAGWPGPEYRRTGFLVTTEVMYEDIRRERVLPGEIPRAAIPLLAAEDSVYRGELEWIRKQVRMAESDLTPGSVGVYRFWDGGLAGFLVISQMASWAYMAAYGADEPPRNPILIGTDVVHTFARMVILDPRELPRLFKVIVPPLESAVLEAWDRGQLGDRTVVVSGLIPPDMRAPWEIGSSLDYLRDVLLEG